MDVKRKLALFKVNKYFIVFVLACSIAGYFKDAALFFICVLLHEICHGIAAHFCKLKIKGIELFPFGGVAKIGDLEYIGTCKEIIVSAAGPVFNMVMAVFLLILNKLNIKILYADTLLDINIMLAVFNILPGFPLDGGRLLRAVLNYYIGFKKATRTAVISGKIISIALLLAGFLMILYGRFNLSLLIMPIFLLYAANQEESTMMFMIMRDVIGKKKYFKNKGIMRAKLLCVYENMYAGDILKYTDLERYHVVFIIGNNMKIEGLLTESQIIENLGIGDDDITIGQLNNKLNGK